MPAAWLIAAVLFAGAFSFGCAGDYESGGAWGEPATSDGGPGGGGEESASSTSTTLPALTPERLAAGKAATMKVCSECHGMRDQEFEEVTPPGRGNHKEWKDMRNGWIMIGPRSRESWERSVKRMVEVDSAVITKSDQELIVDWLAELYGPEE